MFALRFAEPLASIKKNKKNVYLYMKKIWHFAGNTNFSGYICICIKNYKKKNRDVHKYKKGVI